MGRLKLASAKSIYVLFLMMSYFDFLGLPS